MRAGWETRTLDQISVNMDNRRRPVTKADRIGGEFPYYGASGIVDYVADYLFDEDTLLISEDGANLLARSTPIAFPASGKYWVNNHAHILKFPDATTQRFVELYLASIPLDGYITGAAQPKLNQSALNSIPISVPPLPEQQRIVTLLDEAFDGIATAKANAEKNLQYCLDLFDIALSDDLNHHRAADTVVQLGRVCGFENGDRGKNYPGKQHRVASGIPFINAGHLSEDGLDFKDMDYISQERFDLLGNGKIKPDDILFCLRGSLGKFASVGALSQGAIASSLVILRPSERLLHEYLMIYFGSRLCAEMITKFKGGAAQPNLGAKDLKSFGIPVPTLALQQDTVSRLSDLKTEIRSLTEIYARKAAALDELKKSLLHRAFNGDL